MQVVNFIECTKQASGKWTYRLLMIAKYHHARNKRFCNMFKWPYGNHCLGQYGTDASCMRFLQDSCSAAEKSLLSVWMVIISIVSPLTLPILRFEFAWTLQFPTANLLHKRSGASLKQHDCVHNNYFGVWNYVLSKRVQVVIYLPWVFNN